MQRNATFSIKTTGGANTLSQSTRKEDTGSVPDISVATVQGVKPQFSYSEA